MPAARRSQPWGWWCWGGYERSLLVLAVTVGFVAVAMLLPGVAGVVSSAVVLLAVAFLVVAGPVKGRSRPAAANG